VTKTTTVTAPDLGVFTARLLDEIVLRTEKMITRSRQSEMLREWTAALGYHFPLTRLLAPRNPVVLMYHGIPRQSEGSAVNADSFERHICFLKKNFALVSVDDLGGRERIGSRVRVMLTFDDGFRKHAEVAAPILRRHSVPACFFISSRHAYPRKYLWFTYLRMLEKHFKGNGFMFDGEFMDMSVPRQRLTIDRLTTLLVRLRPHPERMYQVIEEDLPRPEDFVSSSDLIDRYAGMTAEQIEELSTNPLFSIGVHTLDHPFLTKCDRAEANRQIVENKTWLENVIRRPCGAIAYPLADYDSEILKLCRSVGFCRGYSVNRSIDYDPELERPRLGIYYPSLNALGFKVRWGNLLREFGQYMNLRSLFTVLRGDLKQGLRDLPQTGHR